ncbi:MAG: MucR family transcriptional regulator [Alphaproteobacteria bacterium]
MTDQATKPVPSGDLLRMTADVVAAYVGHNPLATNDLPGVINAIHASLTDINEGGGGAEPLKPAVPIRRSVTPEFIICLEDGRKLKMLKRHLRTSYNLTPDQYRARWPLGPDYPMVAPNYAKRRSEFAKKIGLGQKTRRKRGAKRRK